MSYVLAYLGFLLKGRYDLKYLNIELPRTCHQMIVIGLLNEILVF